MPGSGSRSSPITFRCDQSRGIFVQAFGSSDPNAALLLLPRFDYVAYDDARMVRTVDAIREELAIDGWLVHRQSSPAPVERSEGAFLRARSG
jgi:GH15 family glucan-1,4-alpha-glucosidase